MKMILTNKAVRQNIERNLSRLAFGPTLLDVYHLGTDYAMGGIEYYGIITEWSGHPAYGDHFQAGIITWHPDNGEWYKDARYIVKIDDEKPIWLSPNLSDNDRKMRQELIAEERARKEATIWLYREMADRLEKYGWGLETIRD